MGGGEMQVTKPQIARELVRRQHDYLHDRIDLVNRSIHSRASHEDIQRLVQEIQGYLAFHFVTEENLMRDIHYPKFKLEEHRFSHSEALDRLSEALADFTHNRITPGKLFEFLFDWNYVHEATEDRELFQFVDKYLNSDTPH